MTEQPAEKQQTLGCPKCGGRDRHGGINRSNAHTCTIKDCDWMLCQCGHIWKLTAPAPPVKE